MSFCARSCHLFAGLTWIFLSSALSLQAQAVEKTEDFDRGRDAPKPTKMYDKSIAEPDEHFVLIRSWDDKPKLPESFQEESPQAPMPKPITARDELLKKFGDPKADTVITPEERAPLPFKAAHAAFEAGDEELAFQYMRQYVRYMEKFKGRIGNIVGMTAKAMEIEGIADGEGWTNSDEYDRFNKYVEQALEEEREEFEEKTEKDIFLTVFPAKMQELIRSPLSEASRSEQQTDEFNRDAIRARLQTVVRPALDGVVKLTLYLDADGDKNSLTMARELSRLADKLPMNSKVSLELIPHKYTHRDQQRFFKTKAGLGSTPFKQWTVDDKIPEVLPTLRIEIPSLEEEYHLEGIRRSTFLEELVELMHGGKI